MIANDNIKDLLYSIKNYITEKPFNYKVLFSRRRVINTNKQELPKFNITGNPYLSFTIAAVLATEIAIENNFIFVKNSQPKFILLESQLNKKIIDLVLFTTEIFIDTSNNSIHFLFRNNNQKIFSKLAPLSYKIISTLINADLSYIQKTEDDIIWILSAKLYPNFFEWIKYYLNNVGILTSNDLINKWKKKKVGRRSYEK